MILLVLWVVTMFLWLLTMIPWPNNQPPAWAHPLLGWLAVLFIGLYVFMPALR